METFSGHHMKICFINHCCPEKQKFNHRWGCALSKFLIHGNSEAGCVPTQGNQTCPIHRGTCARTGRISQGNFLLEAQGNAHTAQNSISRCFQSWPGRHRALVWDMKKGALLWAVSRGHRSNSLPDSLVPAWPSFPKGGHCFTVSTDSDISLLMCI